MLCQKWWNKYVQSIDESIKRIWRCRLQNAGFLSFRWFKESKIHNHFSPKMHRFHKKLMCCTWRSNICWICPCLLFATYYSDVITSAMASQITSVSIVCSTVSSSANQRKHQSCTSLALRGEFTGDRWIPRKWPLTQKMFPFDDVIMYGDPYHKDHM